MPSHKRIVVLSRQPESHTAKRLMAAAAVTRMNVEIVDPHQLSLHVSSSTTRVSHPEFGSDWAQTVVLPRLSSLATEYSLTVLHALSACGVPSVNDYDGVLRLRHKFQALGELAATGICVPDSAMLRAPGDIAPLVKQLGGYPVVLKFIRGSQGIGVIFAPDAATVTSVLEALNLVQYDVMLQRYYPAAREHDLRVLVIGGKARWAVRRHSAAGAFRANYHRGGTAEAVDLTTPLAELAEYAASVFGLGLAGVDMIEDSSREAKSGLVVLEVNGSPGFQAIEACHDADVAAAILEYAAGGAE